MFVGMKLLSKKIINSSAKIMKMNVIIHAYELNIRHFRIQPVAQPVAVDNFIDFCFKYRKY